MAHTILITAHPRLLPLNRRALSYCESIVAEGERINQIFFMHDANFIAIHPSAQQWSAFAAEHGISLQTCVSTAEQKSIHLRDYAAGFQQGGLSSLADSILSSEHLVQFNEDFTESDMYRKSGLTDKKKIVFIFKSAPKENSLAAEGVDLLLVLSAFEADIGVVFQGDGILNITESETDRPSYTKRFKALADFDVEKRYILDGKSHNIEVECEMLTETAFQQIVQESHTLYF